MTDLEKNRLADYILIMDERIDDLTMLLCYMAELHSGQNAIISLILKHVKIQPDSLPGDKELRNQLQDVTNRLKQVIPKRVEKRQKLREDLNLK